ncbi:MAG: prolipoprotein diacylglyceryl transferase [Desulfobacteraceae bacterium 4484_190.3]|nr:MAG: prolipoprotein diacylglyceryl transferase [Desulfobacteraceae bacterium 4484_190.3]
MDRLINFWQHIPEKISPTIFHIGSFQLRYYGLMYLVAFGITYLLVMYRIKKEGYSYSKDTIQDYFVWAILGLLVGARLGYVLFYNTGYYLEHPLEVVFPFDPTNGFRYIGISGMSYHGGAIGVFVATLIFCRKHGINFWNFADLFCAAIPLGYTFGRIGNFINGELYGRITSVPWGMYFPLDAYHQLHHPSQLYEAFFEGIFLFVILWRMRKKKYFDGFLSSLYLISYGIVRFFIEFFREPDPQLGFVLGILTMGQVLCLLMIVWGIILMVKRKQLSTAV